MVHSPLTRERMARHARAAADLCVTQGAVSHRIRQLEEALGFPLFLRLPRGLTLTGEGERLYDILQRPVWDLENEIRRIRHMGLTGTLMVHCPPSLAGAWLARGFMTSGRSTPVWKCICAAAMIWWILRRILWI